MSDATRIAARNLGLCFLIVAVLYALLVIWNRERVKRHLTEKGCSVLKVRWKPFVWWGPARATAFVVEYVDVLGLIHRGRCWTLGFPFQIRWREDEVIGDARDVNAPWPRGSTGPN